MSAVKEKDSAFLDLVFRNIANQMQAPLSITYRIDDVDSGQQLRAWTALDPAPSLTLQLTSSDNRMVGAGDQERRMVTVVASYGLDGEDQKSQDFIYTVQRLRFLDVP